MSLRWQQTLPHDVYEIADNRGAILYVGISMNTERRLLQHRSRPWFAGASTVRISTHPDRDAAKRAEGLRIAEAKPPHNAQLECWSAARGKAQPPIPTTTRNEAITHGR